MPLNIIRADITTLDVDAIVCPTNKRLLPGSGIDYLVHKKAGREFSRDCLAFDHLDEGDAVVIDGHDLGAEYVIMTVGPHWNGGSNGELEILQKAYKSSLEKVAELSLSSVAVPLISAGYYGVPDSISLKTATSVICDFLSSYDAEVDLVVFNRDAFDLSKGIFKEVAELIDDNKVTAWETGRGKSRCTPRDKTASLNVLPDDLMSMSLSFSLDPAMDKCREKMDTIPPLSESRIDALEMENHSSLSPELSNSADKKMEMRYSRASLRRFDGKELEKMEKLCTEGFSDYLRNKVLEKGMTGVECYKKANISHKLYSKIMCDKNYRPGRDTAIAFALALQLPSDEFSEMLSVAGFALSPYDRRDVVIRYFVEHDHYDILELNEMLFCFDLVPLGYKK